MIIAVLSDSHDNIWNLEKALKAASEKGARLLVHCGDYCAPFVLMELAKFDGQVHGVFGNVDGDKFLMANFVNTEFHNIVLHGDIGELMEEGSKIAFVHSPKVGKALAATGDYDVVFYGHSHEKSLEKVGDCLLVNPGEIMGRINAASFCLYDTESRKATHIEIA